MLTPNTFGHKGRFGNVVGEYIGVVSPWKPESIVSPPLPENRFERSLVTKDQIDAFASDGVVKIPQAIDRRWIAPLLALTERQLARPSRWVTDSNRGATKGRIFTDRYLWREHPLIKSFVFESGVARLAGE